MASLYQRFTGKINTSKSFPHPPEASHLLGGQVEVDEKTGKAPQPAADGRIRAQQYRKRNTCEDEDPELSFPSMLQALQHLQALQQENSLLICSLCFTEIMCFNVFPAGEDDSLASKKKITIEDLFSKELQGHDPEAKWLSGEDTVVLAAPEVENTMLQFAGWGPKGQQLLLSAQINSVIFFNNYYYFFNIDFSIVFYFCILDLYKYIYTVYNVKEYYITMVKWATSTKLAVNWLNRAQNNSILTLCEATTGICTKKHEDESDSWLHRQNEAPLFSRDGLRFFFTRAVPQGGRGKFFHISMSTSQHNSSSDTLQSLTSGDWDVTEILAYNEETQLVYFLSTEDSPRKRQLYSADTTGSFNRRCLSCEFSCGYVSGSFSPESSYFLLNCKGQPLGLINTVYYFILINHSLISSLCFIFIPTALSIQILKPAGFKEAAHYPLLLLVDGTPGGQVVTEQFQVDWATVLVSSYSIIVIRFDGRGSGFQGTNLLHRVKRKLGQMEEIDQLEALRIISQESYVDKSRIGVFGRVYGGYVASLLLGSEDSPFKYNVKFKCGAVVSPITDFSLYASAFSERYLGLPRANQRVYEVSNLAQRSGRLDDKKFLIIHPTADEKVHFQHTAKYITHLINEKANYTLQIYPDEGHFLHSEESRQHLSQSLVNFFEVCFRPPEIVSEEELEQDHEDDG
uniref:Dipeptidyl-peptidase 6b n=1 Tax=Astyanax mexicanus TaxID=7994 RepID=A0A8B9L5Z1_ASTMX